MISFLNKLFGKPAQKAVRAVSIAPLGEAGTQMPRVEVVHLSLPTIVARLPEDLQPLLKSQPAPDSTVALPLQTIIKQLAGGSVKISLASLHRQAPAGVFGPLPPGDKRLVEVPLAEVFRHVSPGLLKRRSDQRVCDLPADDLSLFGNTSNPYELAPKDSAARAPEPPSPVPAPTSKPKAAEVAPVAKPLILPEGRASQAGSSPGFRVSPPLTAKPLAPTAEFAAAMARPSAPTAPHMDGVNGRSPQDPSLTVPLAPLAGAWPEEIRRELEALNGSATVALPTADVTAGLAKGKVTFTWGQISSWLSPNLSAPSSVDGGTILALPLKAVAPIFLQATKRAHAAPRPTEEVDATIPTLFNSTKPAPVKAEKEPEPQHAEQVPAEPKAEAEQPASPEEQAPAPAVELRLEARAETASEAPPMEQVAPPAESRPAEAPHAESHPEEHTPSLGALFGQPEKQQWTPGEMVTALGKIPGVAGAVVALQEGLLVAEAVSETMKGETFAAFLPQIFGRLNQYAHEMHLGDVDDLLFTTKGAHCQIYRLGIIYFAVLGKPAEALPWPEIRAVAEELSRQSPKGEREY